MTGLGPADVQCLQIYDAFSIHVPMCLSGFGFCSEKEAGPWLESGHHYPGGDLPMNTAGGHLAESYMHGWSHLAEAVRQARGDAGARQVADCEHVQCVTLGAGRVKALMFERRS
jgi:hypothetical protein